MKDTQLDVKTSDANKIDSLGQQLKEKDTLIEQLLEQISQMKTSFHALVESTDPGSKSGTSSESVNGVGDHSEVGEPTHVAKIPMRYDESYFVTYSNYGIHYDMLSVSVN